MCADPSGLDSRSWTERLGAWFLHLFYVPLQKGTSTLGNAATGNAATTRELSGGEDGDPLIGRAQARIGAAGVGVQKVLNETAGNILLTVAGEGAGKVGEALIPYSSRALARAAKLIKGSTNEITVGSRAEAEELFLNEYQAQGYRNTTGMNGKQVRHYYGVKAGTYHWDMSDIMHGGQPHLQIHTFEGDTKRIFFLK
jgi:hypothetical protein